MRVGKFIGRKGRHAAAAPGHGAAVPDTADTTEPGAADLTPPGPTPPGPTPPGPTSPEPMATAVDNVSATDGYSATDSHSATDGDLATDAVLASGTPGTPDGDNATGTALPPVAPPRTLATDAPQVGDHLQPLPLPRLAPTTTSLPGLRADGGLLGDRWLGAASLAGQSHLNGGSTAQDAYQFTLSDDGSLLIAAVCDGMGSRPLTSQIGAVLLASLLCEEARTVTAGKLAADPRAVLGGILDAACARVTQVRTAGLPGLTDRDLSCTAALALLPATGTGWAARVGDCAVLRLAGEAWETVFARDGGPVNMVSAALPHPTPAEVAEYAPLAEESPGDCLILASDGLAEDAFGSPAVRAWLAERWSRPCDAAAMADSLRYRRRGSHDDRTALVVWSRQLRNG